MVLNAAQSLAHILGLEEIESGLLEALPLELDAVTFCGTDDDLLTDFQRWHRDRRAVRSERAGANSNDDTSTHLGQGEFCIVKLVHESGRQEYPTL